MKRFFFNLFKEIYGYIDTQAEIARNMNLKEGIYFSILYTTLKIKKIFYLGICGISEGSFNVWGKKLYFPDFNLFEMMFKDVFIKKLYSFETNNSSPVMLDCGANIGLGSFFLKIRYPNAKIIAFEPAKLAFRYLKKNLSQFDNCKTIKTALLMKNKKFVYIETPAVSSGADISSSANQGISKIRWENVKTRKEKVKASRLSDYIKKGEIIDFVSIDVEGSEKEIIDDLLKTKKLTQIKEIFFEYHNHKKSSYSYFVNVFAKNGYKIIPSGDVKPPLPPHKDQFFISYFLAYKK